MTKPKTLTNQWINEQAKELGLKVCYTELGGAGEGAMKKDEKTKTAEVLGRKGRKNYEQNLECVSRRSETNAGEDRREYIREGERDETLQDAVTVQVDNTGEVRR